MISPDSFTTDWITRKRAERIYSKANPALIEKMIYALGLLEALVRQQLTFTFKGGTSLVILLDEPKRFSVDIDILTMHSRAELEDVLNAVIAEGRFTAWELDEPRSYKHGLPKAHYFLNYRSSYNVGAGYILLDVLYEEHRYPVTARRSISSKWLSLEGEALRVETPSIDSILGDKLTAFAPNTTGVPYGKYKSLEIVKQLHDIGHLFDHAQDIEVVSRSFNEIVAQQISYRKMEIARDQVFDDIIDTAFMLARSSKHHNEIEVVRYKEIMAGMVQFRSYLMSGGYSLDLCIESAAKAAYLAAKLKTKNFDALERHDGRTVDFQFKSMPYNTLNRLRNLRTGSLYYWSKTALLLQIE